MGCVKVKFLDEIECDENDGEGDGCIDGVNIDECYLCDVKN